ncbi:MAG: hypothetical protein OXI20_10455 [Rhodospirillales bacterium]|nr:hypothetical protein [Rhodospirillales bacterium]
MSFPRFRNGKQLAAGEGPSSEFDPPPSGQTHSETLLARNNGRPVGKRRKCACGCGRTFQPTERFRLIRRDCWKRADESPYAPL